MATIGGYQIVEYIESSGTQYIDTGIAPGSYVGRLKIEADMAFSSTPTGSSTTQALFGAGYYNSTTANRRQILVGYRGATSTSKPSYMNAGGSLGDGVKAFSDATLDANRHIYGIDQVNSNFIFDDKTQSFSTSVSSTLTRNLLIFASEQSSSSGSPVGWHSSAKCYGFKIYDGDTLLRDFVPVRNGSVGGLYDKVSETLFTNSGTGSFTYGSDMMELSAVASPSGSGTFEGVGLYTIGSEVTLTATAGTRWKFNGWDDGVMDNPRDFTLTEDISLIANFYKNLGIDLTAPTYYLYGKKRRQMHQKPTFHTEIARATITEDLLQKANSTIECLDDCSNLEEGDIVFVRDEKNNKIFDGVVSSVDGNVLEVGQGVSFYNINYYAMADSSAEKSYFSYYSTATQLQRYLFDIHRGFLCSKFIVSGGAQEHTIDEDVSTNYDMVCVYPAVISQYSFPVIPFRTDSEVLNIEEYLYDVYSRAGLLTIMDFDIGETERPATEAQGQKSYSFDPSIGFSQYSIDPYPEYTFGDNSEFLQNINVVSEGEGLNALMIFNSSGTTFRQGYALGENGGSVTYLPFPGSSVTADWRYHPTKMKVVNSDDTLTEIRDAELSLQQYNHKITMTMLFKNNFYDFFDIKLGQKFNFYVGNRLYKSLLTGWKFEIESGKKLSSIDLTCGKVRTSLTSKLNLGVK